MAISIKSLNNLGKIISRNISSVIRQKGNSQNGFSNKRTFLTPWYAHLLFRLITNDFINYFRPQSWYINNLSVQESTKTFTRYCYLQNFFLLIQQFSHWIFCNFQTLRHEYIHLWSVTLIGSILIRFETSLNSRTTFIRI